VPTWQKDKTGAYQQHPYLGTYYYRVNVTKPPLNNKLVRQALALGLDRERIVKFVTLGGELPGTTFTPPGTGGFRPKPVLPKDASHLAKAKELLAKAGFPGGKGLPPIELLYNTSDKHKKIAETLQQMWKQNLGIDVKLFNQEWKVYLDSQRTLNYQLSRAGWIGDYNDPNTFLDMFVTDGGNNQTGFSNKRYDELIAKAAQEQNLKKRLAIFQEVESILLDELPVIPIYIYTRVYLKEPSVVGWYPNIEDIHPLKHVSIVPTKMTGAE
jgi:oligopeptide transport system substrate-binding protein